MSMKLHQFLKPEHIVVDCRMTTTENVLEEMVRHLKLRNIIHDEELILDKLLEREKLGTTSIGHFSAVPHTKLKDLTSPIIAVGVSKSGFKYHEDDKKPVHFIILILSPSHSSVIHLQILAAAASLVKKSGRLIKKIVAAQTPQELIRLIEKYENEGTDD